MPIVIRSYKSDDKSSVGDFNKRLKKGGIRFQFPVDHIPEWLPNIDNRNIFQEHYLAIDSNSNVRGGYVLKHQVFYISGTTGTIGDYQLPISEGVIDKAYNLVGLQLLSDALKKQPLMYALGMGGTDQPLPMFLKSMRWSLEPVPFYYKILRPARFLRNIKSLRTSQVKKIMFDFLALSGLGWAGLKVKGLTGRASLDVRQGKLSTQLLNQFDNWVDDLWEKSRDHYSFIAVRDSETLNILYPENNKRFIKLQIINDAQIIGWAVLLCTDMSDHRQFGNMRVGTLVDCLALPQRESEVILTASKYLEKLKPDLIVTNQSFAGWISALEKTGFNRGPSNFVLAMSPKLVEAAGQPSENIPSFHFTRGDGDGPINL